MVQGEFDGEGEEKAFIFMVEVEVKREEEKEKFVVKALWEKLRRIDGGRQIFLNIGGGGRHPTS